MNSLSKRAVSDSDSKYLIYDSFNTEDFTPYNHRSRKSWIVLNMSNTEMKRALLIPNDSFGLIY